MFVDITKKPIEKNLISDLISMRGIKFDISIKVKYYKWKQIVSELTKKSEFVIEEWLPWINTKIITITNAYEINMNCYYEYFIEKNKRFQREGSGWRIEGILSCNVNVSQYTPLRGSSNIGLPEKIKNKQCWIYVKNNDNKFFMWSILSALHPIDRKNHPDRIEKYTQYENSLKFDDINFPVKLDKIPKFEKLNNININVFDYDKKYNIFPLQISKIILKRLLIYYLLQMKITNIIAG